MLGGEDRYEGVDCYCHVREKKGRGEKGDGGYIGSWLGLLQDRGGVCCLVCVAIDFPYVPGLLADLKNAAAFTLCDAADGICYGLSYENSAYQPPWASGGECQSFLFF